MVHVLSLMVKTPRPNSGFFEFVICQNDWVSTEFGAG